MATEEQGAPEGKEEGGLSGKAQTPVEMEEIFTFVPSKVSTSTEIIEETPPTFPEECLHLVVEMPSAVGGNAVEDFVRLNMPETPSCTPKRVNFSPSSFPSFARSPVPSPPKSKSTIKSLLPKLSFLQGNAASDVEKSAVFATGGSPLRIWQKPVFSRSLSFTKLFAPRIKRTASLPVTPILHSNPESTHGQFGIDSTTYTEEGTQQTIRRSHSVPVINKDESLSGKGYMVRLIPVTPGRGEGINAALDKLTAYDSDVKDDGGEDIPEEEAVCRICLIELGEDSETLKMECCCRGELALAHKECAVKWFSTKGNRICDVCKQEVRNLPVTLLRIQNVQTVNMEGRRAERAETSQNRVWQDIPILVIVSMLAYFGFLEQLLVGKMGTDAIAITLPFSCILGLLASMTASTMVSKRYVWFYATIQFIMVVIAAQIFYMMLHLQAVLSILIATFAGFGSTMCLSFISSETLKWSRRWLNRLGQHSRRAAEVIQLNGATAVARQSHTAAPSHSQQGTQEAQQQAALPVTIQETQTNHNNQ